MGRWWESSTISCLKATYQVRSHGQSGGHWPVRQLLRASTSSLTASQASSCSLCCHLSDQLLRAGPIFEVPGPAMAAQAVATSGPTCIGQRSKRNSPQTLSALFQKAWKFLPFSSLSPFHKSFACRAASLGSLILLSKVNRPPMQRQMNNKQRGKKKKTSLPTWRFFFSACLISQKNQNVEAMPQGCLRTELSGSSAVLRSPSHRRRHPIFPRALPLTHACTYGALRILAPKPLFLFQACQNKLSS